MALHAPPVEILKRATTAEDAAGHRVRSMFYADGEFMTRFGIPLAVSCYGSTEAAGVSHLHQWRLGEEIPTDASRYGGAAAGRRRRPAGRRRADPRPRTRARHPVRRLLRRRQAQPVPATTTAGSPPATWANATRRAGCGSWSAPRSRSGSRASSCPFPFVEERLGTIPELVDLALWKKPGELVDDEVVLYAVADERAGRARSDRSPQQLPAFMRPSHVAQIRAIPRDAAAGKVQRRLLRPAGGAVVDPAELTQPGRPRCPTGQPTWSTCTCTPPRACCPGTATTRRWSPRSAPSASARWCSSRTKAPPWSAPQPSATVCTAGSCSTARSAAPTRTPSRWPPGWAGGWCGCPPSRRPPTRPAPPTPS